MTTLETGTTLDVERLAGTIGAVVHGLDLRRPLAPPSVAAVRRALLDHKVVFFPDQHLDPVEHVAFARQFGELTAAHPVVPGIDGHPEVFELDYTRLRSLLNERGQIANRNGEGWHTDVTFVRTPPLGSVLNAVVMPAYGGDTAFADTEAAYRGLSAPLRRLVDGLTAVHDGGATFGEILRAVGQGTWDGEPFTELVPTEHPLVRTHPETGARNLFVNPGFTTSVKDLNPLESRALLDLLFRHMTVPEYTVRYRWRQGDVGFWDNRTTMHYAVNDYGDQHRVIQRVTLRGGVPT